MALYRVSAGAVSGPDGAIMAAPPFVTQRRPWYPGVGPYTDEPGLTSFLPDVQNERDVLMGAPGFSALARDFTDYFAAGKAKAALVDGPFFRKGVGPTTVAGAVLCYPALGALPDPSAQSFTLELPIQPVGVSGVNTTKGALLWAGGGDGNDGLAFYTRESGANSITAAWRLGALLQIKATITGLVDGDIPADEWSYLSYLWDHLTQRGTVILTSPDEATQTATSAPGPAVVPKPYIFRHGYIASATGSDFGTSGEWKIGEPCISSHKRVLGPARDSVVVPAITVDTATDDGSGDLTQMGGLMCQAAGFGDEAYTSYDILDTALAATLADGCTTYRISHALQRVVWAGTAADPTVSDASALWRELDPIAAAAGHVHFSFEFTPTILRPGGGSQASDPTSHTGYALACSRLLTACKTRYGATYVDSNWWGGGWNEGDNGGFFSGDAAAYADVWIKQAQQFATDHPNFRFGNDDAGFDASNVNLKTRAILDAAGVAGIEPEFLIDHAYADEDYSSHERWQFMRDYAASQALSVRELKIGEMAFGYGSPLGFYVSETRNSNIDLRALNGHPSAGPDYGADLFARIYEAWKVGVTSAITTRLTQLGLAFGGTEQVLGIMSAEARPWDSYAALQCIWKLRGQPIQVTSNRTEYLRALGAVDDDGTITFAYGTQRRWRPTDLLRFSFGFTQTLPATFKWEMWRKDWRDSDRTAHDGRLVRVGGGDQTNLPLGTDLTIGGGVGCLKITP